MTRRRFVNAVVPRLRRLAERAPDALARRLRRDQRASIAILAALSMIALVGAAAMALDLARLYLAKSTAQRIADQSALAAAFAYSQSIGNTSTGQNAASAVATANGAGSDNVTAAFVTSPSGDGNTAAKVTISAPVSLSPFGSLTMRTSSGAATTVSVGAVAYAEISDKIPGCLVALGSTGVLAINGASVTATDCAIASDGSVAASGGSTIKAQAIYAVGSITAVGGSTIETSPTSGQTFAGSSTPTDPYKNAGVFNGLTADADLPTPSFPSGVSAPTTVNSTPTCGSTPTLTLSSAISWGTIATSYSPTCQVFDFSGSIGTTDVSGGLHLNMGSTVNFNSGTYSISGGITVGGGAAATINVDGPATFYIWGGITTDGGSTLTIRNTTTATSTYYIAGGIDITGGSASFASGTYVIVSGDSVTGAGIDLSNGGNSATFGNGSFQIAGGINLAGSATLVIGSPLNSNSVFQISTGEVSSSVCSGVTPDLAICTGGGSTLELGCSSTSNCPGFPTYDINGTVDLVGNTWLGSGTYLISGDFDAGTSGGGNSINGSGVSIITAGTIYFGAGFNAVNLSAPSTLSGSSQGTASTVVLASKSTSGSTVTAGASNTQVQGAIYTPNATLTVNGGGTLTGGANGCLEVLASSLSIGTSSNGGGKISTSCGNLSSGGNSATVTLVQ